MICHSFIIIFHVGILMSTTHNVLYALLLMHEGYRDYIIGIIEPSFLLFLSPYYLSVDPPFCSPNTCPIRYLFDILQQFPGGPLLLV